MTATDEIPLDLVRAYLATEYRVHGGPQGPLTLRVGEPSPALDRLLDAEGAHRWAYLTACNPRSQPLPPQENARRLRALEEELGGRYRLFPGEGVLGAWREASILVLGMDEAEALAAGARWEQNAVVVGRRGGAPALLLL